MHVAKQLSVSLVNKPGRLADILIALGKGKVSVLALSVMDSTERGTIRFVPDDVGAAKKILDEINIRYETTDVLLIDIPSQPGSFRKICERIAADHLHIDYAYCSFESATKTKAERLAVLKVNDLAKAQRLLSENGTVRKRMPFRRPVALSR